jgi:flagellin
MALSVNTNMGAMVALQNLKTTERNLGVTQNRISTGLKVSGVKDESSTWNIAQNIRGDLSGLNAVTKSLDRAKSTLDLTIAAGESISDLLLRGRELAAQVADVGIDTFARDAINNDFRNLMRQIDSQVQSSEFNGTNLLKANPDGISGILSVNGDSSVDRFGVQGLDIRTSSEIAKGQVVATPAALTFVAGSSETLAGLMSKRTLANAGTVVGTGANVARVLASSTAYSAAGPAANAFQFDVTNGNIVVGLSNGGNYNNANGQVTLTLGGATFTATVQANQIDGSQIALKADQLTWTAGNLTGAATGARTAGGAANGLNFSDYSSVANGQQSFIDRMQALSVVDQYQAKVKTQLSAWGAQARQLDMQIAYSTKLRDSWESGVGNLVDADLASESAKLQGLQVRQQLGVQALSLANQAPQSLLSLFR